MNVMVPDPELINTDVAKIVLRNAEQVIFNTTKQKILLTMNGVMGDMKIVLMDNPAIDYEPFIRLCVRRVAGREINVIEHARTHHAYSTAPVSRLLGDANTATVYNPGSIKLNKRASLEAKFGGPRFVIRD